ncbi:MAG: ATP-grasp domain-containing protein [Patescibacteria group bacterium]|jgi:glutathione synthase/RimK-type ligase-like ATP-grasp enzyme
MKKVGILYDTKVGFNRKKPFIGRVYNADYLSLLKAGQKHDIIFYLAPYTAYKNRSFTKSWIYTDKWVKINKPIKLDAVFDKIDGDVGMPLKKKIDKELPLVNRYALDLIFTDKWLTYKLCPQFSSKTVLGPEINKAKKFNSDLIVAKPRFGSSGVGIEFVKRDKLKKFPKSYILQEFIEGGKMFHATGQHDFRVYMCDGQIVFSTLRTPFKKKYLCNVGQGGRERFYWPPLDIPQSMVNIIKTIDKLFKKYDHRFYSIDFMMSKQGKPIVLELNSRPGLTHFYDKDVKNVVDEYVCRMFERLLIK